MGRSRGAVRSRGVCSASGYDPQNMRQQRSHGGAATAARKAPRPHELTPQRCKPVSTPAFLSLGTSNTSGWITLL